MCPSRTDLWDKKNDKLKLERGVPSNLFSHTELRLKCSMVQYVRIMETFAIPYALYLNYKSNIHSWIVIKSNARVIKTAKSLSKYTHS